MSIKPIPPNKKTGLLKALFFFSLLIFAFSACKKDRDKPKTSPVVETGVVTDITTEFAQVNGKITDNGNNEITNAGFVYSTTVSLPTTSDTKVEVTDTEGDFTTMLEDLNSGSVYHIRAFATNSIGTGYGEVVDFTTGNAAPTATDVTITGDAEVNKKLIGNYIYHDNENNAEGTSTFKWYRANDALGAGETAIDGAIEKEYTIQDEDQGKFIRFGVTPKAGTGTATGVEAKSPFTSAVGEATTVTFMYNGTEVTYNILTSVTTGKQWLDRNLGAPNAATSFEDYANYGDLFQWGRAADGHQVAIHTGSSSGQVTLTGTSTTLSSGNTAPNSLFITPSDAPYDWISPQNPNLWQGANGINNPCPSGWRLPTLTEFDAEGITEIIVGYDKLKLTLTGVRIATGAHVQANQGWYWTSNIETDNSPNVSSKAAFFSKTFYTEVTGSRANGQACRCIKD